MGDATGNYEEAHQGHLGEAWDARMGVFNTSFILPSAQGRSGEGEYLQY